MVGPLVFRKSCLCFLLREIFIPIIIHPNRFDFGVRCIHDGYMTRWFGKIVTFGDYLALGGFWFTVWLYRALLVTLMGGIVGFGVSSLIKMIFSPASGWMNLLTTGFIVGCEYAGIWATGVAFIWVIMDRHRIKTVGLRLLGQGVGNKTPAIS
jgi:hypothetical protein